MNEEEFNKYTDRPEDARAEILNFEEIVLPGNLKTYLVERVSNLELDDVNYSNNANIAIAASITAQGRIEMSKFKHVPGLDLKYFDTDSIFTSTSPEKLNQLFPHIVHPNQIGKLKLEGIAKKAVFLAPKAYALLMEDGSLTVKIKGLSKEAIDRAINKGILTIESMAGLLSQGRTIGSIPIIHSHSRFSKTGGGASAQLKKKTMKNNKRLTLKLLQSRLEALKTSHNKELENLKANTPNIPSLKIEDKSKGFSYMTSSFLPLYLLSWVALFVNKMPFAWRLIPFFTKFTAKSSWLATFIYFRKLFIVINALIGMIYIFGSGWIENGSILASISMIGNNYLELLGGFLRKVFNFSVDFLDSKVVPDLPRNFPPSGPPSEVLQKFNLNSLIDKQPIEPEPSRWSLRRLYSNNSNSSSWFTNWDWTPLLYFAGGIIVVTSCYLIYSFVKPQWDATGYTTPPTTTVVPPTPPVDPAASPPPPGGDAVASMLAAMSSARTFTSRVVNPYNWFSDSTHIQAATAQFMADQQAPNLVNKRFYPYTPHMPYESFWDKIKLRVFGEGIGEEAKRLATKRMFLDTIHGQFYNVPSRPSSPLPGFSNLLAPEIGNLANRSPVGFSRAMMPPIETGNPIFSNQWISNASPETQVLTVKNALLKLPSTPVSLAADSLLMAGSHQSWEAANTPVKEAIAIAIEDVD